MRIITILSIAILNSLLFAQCQSSRKISGIYVSKFAVLGFFGTIVVLNSDSSFTYTMQGDLAYDTAAGSFEVAGKYLILKYRTLPIDTSISYNAAKSSLLVHEQITGNPNLTEPKKYIIGHNKLFLVDQNGKKVKYQLGYRRIARFFPITSKLHKRRFFLKKRG